MYLPPLIPRIYSQILSTISRLEAESRVYFSLEYLKNKMAAGKLDEADHYLSYYLDIETKEDANILFLLRKLKYFEALSR